MRDRDRFDGMGEEPSPDDRIELEDSGETLESALAEEERSAVAAAEEKLQSVRNDLEELRDRHLRKLAEFDNLRKRSEREREEYYRAALSNFIRDFLPITDDFERALAHATPEDLASDFGQGIVLIHRKINELWKKYGLREVDTSAGFDPNVHEAVATEYSERVPPNTILDVLQKGYLLGDRLIRPALVKVSTRDRETPEGGVIAGSREAARRREEP